MTLKASLSDLLAKKSESTQDEQDFKRAYYELHKKYVSRCAELAHSKSLIESLNQERTRDKEKLQQLRNQLFPNAARVDQTKI